VGIGASFFLAEERYYFLWVLVRDILDGREERGGGRTGMPIGLLSALINPGKHISRPLCRGPWTMENVQGHFKERRDDFYARYRLTKTPEEKQGGDQGYAEIQYGHEEISGDRFPHQYDFAAAGDVTEAGEGFHEPREGDGGRALKFSLSR
jgi:hypothetical protein